VRASNDEHRVDPRSERTLAVTTPSLSWRFHAGLWALIAVGCSCGSGSAPPPMSAPPTSTAAAVPPTSAPRTSTDDADARAAYRSAIDAFNRHDETGYIGAFEQTLDCFYGRANVSVDDVRRERWGSSQAGSRLVIASLSTLSRSTDEIALLDRGFFHEPGAHPDAPPRQGIHQKIIVMHRDGDTWHIAAETNSAGASCLSGVSLARVVPDTAFTACRQAHEACTTGCNDAVCGDACEREALRCIGVRVPGAPAEPASPVAIRTEDDVRRYVTLLAQPYAGDVDGRAWLSGAQVALGAPLFRHGVGGGGAFSVCSSWPLGDTVESRDTFDDEVPTDDDGNPDEPAGVVGFERVSEVHCSNDAAGALSRCVVSLEVTDRDEHELAVDVTLLFDGQQLRVSHTDPSRPRGPAPSGLLDRYAVTRPPEWDLPCARGLLALTNDRVGDDYFEVVGPDSYGATDQGVVVHHLCGADARRAVHALGDDWPCDDDGCATESCSCDYDDYSRRIILDGDRVLAYIAANEVDQFTAADRDAVRAHVACGARAPFSPAH
jgi:hypothetical protein